MTNTDYEERSKMSEWYVENVYQKRLEEIKNKLGDVKLTFTPIVEEPDEAQLLKLREMRADIIAELRKQLGLEMKE